MKLYLKVTTDKYELPLVVADSQSELARICGISKSTVASSLCAVRNGRCNKSAYKEVEIDDD